MAETVGERLGTTLGLIGTAVLFSLALALVLLFVGKVISRATGKPPWLAKTRGVLRLVLTSAAVSAPVFIWQTFVLVYPSVWWGVPAQSLAVFWVGALTVSILPAWLLVQYGQGVIAAWPGEASHAAGGLWGRLGVRLVIRVLKLVGAIIVITMFVAQPSLGRQVTGAVAMRDFPLLFGIVWAIVVIVVLAKMAGDLIEIAYNHYGRRPAPAANAAEPAHDRTAIPKGWLVFCLALVGLFLVIAVAAPLLAPHGYNEMVLGARFQPPSSQYLLGTDNLGRDILSRLIWGIRQDLFLSLLSVGIMFAVAIGSGILAARVRRTNDWRGDTLEDVVVLPRDLLCAFPWLVLVLLLMSMVPMRPGPVTLTFFSYALPVALAIGVALLPRAVGIMQEAYSSAPAGRGRPRTVALSVPVMLLFAVAGGLLYLAAAGNLGYGVLPPSPELGGMLAGPARRYMLQAPWMAVWPPVVIVLLLTAWVMAGDALLERMGFRTKALWSKMWE